MKARIGVLGFQGSVTEHVEAVSRALENIKVESEVLIVKKASDIKSINGIIIPGGESTVIGRLAEKSGLLSSLRIAILNGLPVFGTCAGVVMLAREVHDAKIGVTNQPILGVMDIKVLRNAFGRQRESFEVDIVIPRIGREPFHAVFIRAPVIEAVLSSDVEVLAKLEDKIVLAQQNNMLASVFHPELTSDLRLHEYFLKKALSRII
ncbi:MAG: pyridoxal 5'-phosphate synthase glutaminase subunit PdxT [Candidatus Methanomethylicia archaeon]